ncbi:MAG: L,D-transpeptidase [Cyanobacteriota bacterium]|nr:L,D-transpeptidase [Cyanobacteriota bacterium]
MCVRPRSIVDRCHWLAALCLFAASVSVPPPIRATAAPISSPAISEAIAHHTGMEDEMQSLKKANGRWIEVDITRQRLIAWEGPNPVYAIVVSTGKPSTPTLPGLFAIQSKYPSVRMQGADYDVPDVPYAMFYYGTSYAIHGAYWHDDFGTPVSRGCTNVAPDHAEWLYHWAAVGTPVVFHY